MASHKNQHFIPRCYLKAWCDPHTPTKQTPYVWQFSNDGEQVRKKSPANIFSETDMYTIENPDGSRNLTLEHGLHELETRFSIIRDRKINRKKPLTREEHIVLCAFVAAMHARTKARREHHAKIWNQVRGQMEQISEKMKTLTPEERQKIRPEPRGIHDRPTISYEKVKEMSEKPLQSWLTAEVKALTPILSKIDLLLLETSDATGFITSDNPCVWFDPEAYKRPPFYQTPALMYETIEITLPLSPQYILLFNRKGHNGHLRINNNALNEFNRRIRFHVHEYFIVNSNVKKEIWFDPGVEPDDSWRKKHQEGESLQEE